MTKEDIEKLVTACVNTAYQAVTNKEDFQENSLSSTYLREPEQWHAIGALGSTLLKEAFQDPVIAYALLEKE